MTLPSTGLMMSNPGDANCWALMYFSSECRALAGVCEKIKSVESIATRTLLRTG